jgi:signal peptidase I
MFKIIYYIFMTFVVVVGLMLVVSSFSVTGNYKLFVVRSGSMEPNIPVGSVVFIKPESTYDVGSVITFGRNTRDEIPTTHRIVEKYTETTPPKYLTKGDANDAPDPRQIDHREILGKVFLSVPYIGYAVVVAKEPIGFTILIIVPALIIIFDEIKKIIQEVRKMRRPRHVKQVGETELVED